MPRLGEPEEAEALFFELVIHVQTNARLDSKWGSLHSGGYTLLKGVGARSPPGKEDGEADGLEELGEHVDADSLKGALLDEQLRDETGGRGGSEDETAEVGGAAVAEGAGGVDEGADTVRLEGRADEGRTPGHHDRGGLTRLGKLLLAVGDLGALVGLAEERGHDGQLGGVVEDGAEGNGRGLDGGKIWEAGVSVMFGFCLEMLFNGC